MGIIMHMTGICCPFAPPFAPPPAPPPLAPPPPLGCCTIAIICPPLIGCIAPPPDAAIGCIIVAPGGNCIM